MIEKIEVWKKMKDSGREKRSDFIHTDGLKNVLLGINIFLLIVLIIRPLPHGLHIPLHVVVHCISMLLAFIAFSRDKYIWIPFFAIVLIIYNPFIMFKFGRIVWIIIDSLVIFFHLIAVFFFRLSPRKKNDLGSNRKPKSY